MILRNAFLPRSFADFEERVPASFLFFKVDLAFLVRSFFVPFQFAKSSKKQNKGMISIRTCFLVALSVKSIKKEAL